MVKPWSNYGQIMVKKGHFDYKNAKKMFLIIIFYLKSAHDDGFSELSLTPLVRKKTQVMVNLLK